MVGGRHSDLMVDGSRTRRQLRRSIGLRHRSSTRRFRAVRYALKRICRRLLVFTAALLQSGKRSVDAIEAAIAFISERNELIFDDTQLTLSTAVPLSSIDELKQPADQR
jgi:hypothetical protein